MRSFPHIGVLFILSVLVVTGICVKTGVAQTNDRIARLIAKVNQGPGTWYTEAALEYYRRSADTPPDEIPRQQQNKTQALRSVRGAIQLAESGEAALPAVGVLVEKYPRIVHVISHRGIVYKPGMGSFDDWLSTKTMAAKNTFLLSSDLLEYATVSKCEAFITTRIHKKVIEGRRHSSGRRGDAVLNMDIVLVLNAGYCALNKITGEDPGDSRQAWEQWLQEHGGAKAFADSSVEPTGTVVSATGGKEFVKGAKYALTLQTGDEYTATVESIDDTSIIVETENGYGLQILKSLVADRELLQRPEDKQDRTASHYTFEELQNHAPEGVILELTLHSGRTLSGLVHSVKSNTLVLNVNDSHIPVTKDAIKRIARRQAQKEGGPDEDAVAAGQKRQKEPKITDSLFVKNPERDEYGKRLEDILLRGEIIDDSASHVIFRTEDGVRREIPYTRITRRIDNTKKDEMSEIERYSQPLFCPEGMVLVDLPPGAGDKPFFKVCIDKYEYPNKKGEMPTGDVSFTEAQKKCRQQGKRLCTVTEWQWACSGREGYDYPYGWTFSEEACNTEGIQDPEESGSYRSCVSKFGAYDMVGNKFEWVRGENGKPMLMGGPRSKCQSVSSGAGGKAKPQTGFRCCKSN